jgi:CSLREA domain-containing protein
MLTGSMLPRLRSALLAFGLVVTTALAQGSAVGAVEPSPSDMLASGSLASGSLASGSLASGSLASGSVASAGVVVTLSPRRAAVGEPVVVRVTLPPSAVAVEGRLTFDSAALELIGVAPLGGGTALYPEAIPGGAVFGAYGLTAHRPAVVRLVLLPRARGVVDVRVVVDALATGLGVRLSTGPASSVATASVGAGGRHFPAPRMAVRSGEPRIVSAAESRDALQALRPGDLGRARAAWNQAVLSGNPCAGAQLLDLNRDGCADIVDVQAASARLGEGAAARSASIGPASVARPVATRPAADYAHTFVVDNTADTADATPGDVLCADAEGHCTLRAAMTEANALAGDDLITFNLAGAAPVTIQLIGRLPTIAALNGSMTIDGYSQPGSRPNTASVGSNAIPGALLRGNGLDAHEVALYVTSPSNLIRGLIFQDLYRGVMLDGSDAHDNLVAGNWIGFTANGDAPAEKLLHGVLLNTGATHNRVGTPDLADRNVIGNVGKAVDSYGPGTNANTIQNNLLCIGPSGFSKALCSNGIDHDFGPKDELAGGTAPNERNVIGPTKQQGIEYSHGWNPDDPSDPAEMWQITGNRAIGNWVGFRGDGSYRAEFRSGQRFSTSDNGSGINVYDGSSHNTIEGNYISAVYDGVNVMAPNAHDNVFRGNRIGISPLGQAAPMAGWGFKVRWGTTHDIIEGNLIRNAAAGGIGLVAFANNGHTPQTVATNIRITRNLVKGTKGPAIFLARQGSGSAAGANNLMPAPRIGRATKTRVTGTGLAGATVEVYIASRKAGAFGLPDKYLGSVLVGGDGTWRLDASLAKGKRVTALQIVANDNTSALSRNVTVVGASAGH